MSATAIIEAPALPEVPPVAAPAPLPKMTVEEYFAFERTQEIRYEYVEGELIAMPGTSFDHDRILRRLIRVFDRAFEDNDCDIFFEAIRVRVSQEKYRYPDLAVVCDPPVSDGENPPALLNPALVVEVLSDSTEATERGEKMYEYHSVPSLTDYLLVAQDRVFVLHCAKQNERQWIMTRYSELSETIPLLSLGVNLPLAEIYCKITFDVQK